MRTTGDYQLSCDVMQESFTRFLARYGPDAPNGALLFAIARNTFLDETRKRKRFMAMADDEGDDTRNQEQHLLGQWRAGGVRQLPGLRGRGVL